MVKVEEIEKVGKRGIQGGVEGGKLGPSTKGGRAWEVNWWRDV